MICGVVKRCCFVVLGRLMIAMQPLVSFGEFGLAKEVHV